MIRKATLKDIDAIIEITKACAKLMVSNNIYQWSDKYPNKQQFEFDAKREELHVLLLDKTIIGCIVMTPLMDDEYKTITWLTPNKNNIYIHRLAVHPKYQGLGHAQYLMDFAERYAIENNYASIRLDTYSKNKKNQNFYELRGYKRTGLIYFRNQKTLPCFCYELVL